MPSYTKVPHPLNPDMGEIRALFHSPKAPQAAQMAACDADFQKLRAATQSKDELADGAKEFVSLQPEAFHWCFYWQFIKLEDALKKVPYHDERQAEVLKAYAYLVPVARAFKEVFQDTRYLRAAAYRYKVTSEYVFFRRVEISAKGAQDLMAAEVMDPAMLWQTAKDSALPVLEKYGLAEGAKAGNADGLLASPTPAATGDLPVPEATTLSGPPPVDPTTGDLPPMEGVSGPAAKRTPGDDAGWQKEFSDAEAEAGPPTPADMAPPPTETATAPADTATEPAVDREPSAEELEAPSVDE